MLNLILSIHEVWANVSFMSLIIYLPQEGEGSGLYALNRNWPRWFIGLFVYPTNLVHRGNHP